MDFAPIAGASNPAGDAPDTRVEDAAALDFEPLAVEMPGRARSIEQAGTAFVCVRVGAAMLTKTPAELTEALKAQGEAGFFLLLEELNESREWFAGYVRLLDAVEARVVVAGARVAVETPEGTEA